MLNFVRKGPPGPETRFCSSVHSTPASAGRGLCLQGASHLSLKAIVFLTPPPSSSPYRTCQRSALRGAGDRCSERGILLSSPRRAVGEAASPRSRTRGSPAAWSWCLRRAERAPGQTLVRPLVTELGTGQPGPAFAEGTPALLPPRQEAGNWRQVVDIPSLLYFIFQHFPTVHTDN